MKALKTTNKKQKAKKIILTSVAVGAAGILGYFGWQYLKRRKESKATNLDDLWKRAAASSTATIRAEEQPAVTPMPTQLRPKRSTSTPPVTPDTSAIDFPLKKGSKGVQVKALQEALMARYGKSTLPKYGADGDFGSEMVSALKKLGLPTAIDQSMFNVLTQGVQSSTTSLGTDLYNATLAGDFNKVMALLKKMKSKDDYTAANEVFKTYRINGVRQTIVNGLLNVFTSEAQKQKIKFEFLRIGLQYDGNKWSLSGIGGIAIITAIPTMVWVNAKQCLQVPARIRLLL